MTKTRVTIADIARTSGVSPSTVSRVLNENESAIPISAETRARVLAAVASLGYRPNLAARALASGRSDAVAVIVHDIADPYFSEIVRGVEDVASARKYMVIVSSTDRDPVRESEYLLRLASFPTDGIILAAGGFIEEHAPQVADSLIKSGTAIVGVSRHQLPIATIDIGNQEGARQMTKHLLGLGHRHIAFLAGPDHLTTATDRLDGYREALRGAGLAANEVILPGDFTREAGIQAVTRVRAQVPNVTAIFAANDKMALGCLAGLRAAGLAVPRDMSVVGFGDIPAAQDTDPPLTTVGVPLRTVGRLAMEQVLSQLSGEAPMNQSVPSTLALRLSAGQPR